MNKVERREGWCSHDYLDGHQLYDKEKLEIEFKDGSYLLTKIKVKSWTNYSNDHSLHANAYQQSQAFVVVDVRGEPTEVPIAGLKARRLEAPKSLRKAGERKRPRGLATR